MDEPCRIVSLISRVTSSPCRNFSEIVPGGDTSQSRKIWRWSSDGILLLHQRQRGSLYLVIARLCMHRVMIWPNVSRLDSWNTKSLLKHVELIMNNNNKKWTHGSDNPSRRQLYHPWSCYWTSPPGPWAAPTMGPCLGI